MTTKPKRAGRKPLSEGEKSVTVCLRMTEQQRAKLKLLGGAKWVRDQIDGLVISGDTTIKWEKFFP